MEKTNIATITDKTGLVEALAQAKGASIVTLVTEVEPRMRKTGNPFIGRVTKVSKVNGMIGWNYQNSVNNQRTREEKTADFMAEPRTWGNRIEKTPFVTHKGNIYLELKVEKVYDTEYRLDGRPATESETEVIKTFIPQKKESSRQKVDRAVILRDYKLGSIRELNAFGESWVIPAESPTVADPVEILQPELVNA